MRFNFKLYYMADWVKRILEEGDRKTNPVPEDIQVAMEKVLDYVVAKYDK